MKIIMFVLIVLLVALAAQAAFDHTSGSLVVDAQHISAYTQVAASVQCTFCNDNAVSQTFTWLSQYAGK